MLEVLRQAAKRRRRGGPIVEGRLQRRCDVARIGAPGEIAADHDEPAVAAVLQACELHSPAALPFCSPPASALMIVGPWSIHAKKDATGTRTLRPWRNMSEGLRPEGRRVGR